MRLLLLIPLTALCACSGMGPTSTSSPWGKEPTSAAPAAPAAATFSAAEIQIIRAYYHANAIGKNGRGKYKRLPPGIARNLRRGKPLPPGIAAHALPHDLLSQLPRPPAGYDRIVVVGKILLVEIGTQIVRDILTDVAFG